MSEIIQTPPEDIDIMDLMIQYCPVCYKRIKWIELDPDMLVELAGSEYIVEVYEHLDGSPNCVESQLLPF